MTRGSRAHWYPAYVGIGSNLDGPEDQVRAAFRALADLEQCRLARTSSLYRSAAVGPGDQPDYVNAVAALLTTLDAPRFLASLRWLEEAAGRVRGEERWAPRVLDLDLLLFGSEVRDEPELTVPHPRIAERNFVLLPLEEIAPHLMIPGIGSLGAVASKNDNSVPRIEKLQ